MVSLIDLERDLSFSKFFANGNAFTFVIAKPHFLQTFVRELGGRILVRFRESFYQICIAIGAVRKSGAVFGLALGTKHKGVEFTTERKRSRRQGASLGPKTREILTPLGEGSRICDRVIHDK